MSRILLLDTNVSAAPLHARLVADGHEVHVCGSNPADFLARTVPAYHRMDYSDPRELSALVQSLRFDRVVPGCNDRSYEAAAQLGAAVARDGIDTPEATGLINNKRAFRELAQRLGVPVPRLILDPAAPGALDLPLIVKPVDAYSGRGVTVLQRPEADALARATETARQVSHSGSVVVETFVEGQLFSHSAFFVDGAMHVDFIVREFCSANPFVVDTSFVDGSLEPGVLAQIRQHVSTIVASLGLVDGLFHTQFILRDGYFWFIEVTRRCPGDLYSHLIESSTGYPYTDAYVAGFTGARLPAAAVVPCPSHVVRHTVSSPAPFVFRSLRFRSPLMVERFVPLCAVGETVAASPAGRVGVLFLDAGSESGLHDIVGRATSRTLYDCD